MRAQVAIGIRNKDLRVRLEPKKFRAGNCNGVCIALATIQNQPGHGTTTRSGQSMCASEYEQGRFSLSALARQTREVELVQPHHLAEVRLL